MKPVKMFVVISESGEVSAAYPRKLQAEVYASGFIGKTQIIEGMFVPERSLR